MDFVEWDDVSVFFDFNNLAIRSFMVQENIKEPEWGLWKYNIFNGIFNTLYKIRNVEEVVLAIDDMRSWRKAAYSRYKESRKKKKKDSDVDWKQLYVMMNRYAAELKHHMPFKVLKVKSAEADDVIGVLVKKLRNPCIIIARDEDYFQLFRNGKKLIVHDPISGDFNDGSEFDSKDFLLSKIFMGQKKDDIPNIYTPNDWGLTESTEGKRRPGFGPKKWESIKHDLVSFLDTPYVNKTYGKEIDLRANMKRNRMLMDFDKIPNTIIQRIVDAYNRSGNFPPIDNIYLFFEKNNMRSFIEKINTVEGKLQRLL